jgi:starch synthase (maltosyl-transferring)
MTANEGRARVVIAGVQPEIDSGRFPVKRTVGEKLVVEADIFADGHDTLSAVVLYRAESESQWHEVPMRFLGNDRWDGGFRVTTLGTYVYTVHAWIDHFTSWRESLRKKVGANQDVTVDLLIGAELLDAVARRATGAAAAQFAQWAGLLRQTSNRPAAIDLALADEMPTLVALYPDRQLAVTYERELQVIVEREKARFSAWYEMFPRSCAPEPGRHGTFKDCEARLPYIETMGFDVLYLPPIHPIGGAFRKGKNHALVAGPNDPGSPWAIGAAEGGHKAIHPELGTLADFLHLVAKAKDMGIEIALDLAFQCSPDHPYVTAHPQWFRQRPDGSIQYAENPPKRYQDIYPLDFETEDWQALWDELKSVVQFWIDQGIRIFRVDNPHTKSFRFWEWMIGDIRQNYPDVIFLSEAFTRPKVRYQLAKLGFNQSYTYFAWRNTKEELTQYLTELTQSQVREYFRPSLWPNTPDILTEYLQFGGRPAFIIRLVLAATLGANYGIYGPAFELCENSPREANSEEYLNSEKYEIRHWDLKRPESLKEIIARVNRIRRENSALQSNDHLQFHDIDNDQLLCYSKHAEDAANVIVVVVNLDPQHTHAGWMELGLERLGLSAHQPYQMHDLLSDARYLWQGARNYIELDPRAMAAHIFRLRHRVRSERDFDYYIGDPS